MRFVVISFIASSASARTEFTIAESGWRIESRLMWARRSRAVLKFVPLELEFVEEVDMTLARRVGSSRMSEILSTLRESCVARFLLSRILFSFVALL